MEDSMTQLALSFDPGAEARARMTRWLPDGAAVVYLTDLDGAARREALAASSVLLSRNTDSELEEDEFRHLGALGLIQFMSAGVDFIDLGRLPAEVPVAGNGGAYAEPMAEHALAMALAALKRLLVEHDAVGRGEFNQFTRNRMLREMTVGILGMGGIGEATAALFKALGVTVHAINRRGRCAAAVDWIGTPADLDALLAASDVLILCLPLTARSAGLIDAPALSRMKPDAVLVNLARGEIVDEVALFAHLQAHPDFTACIDAWWVEPIRHGEFRMGRPFTTLPNVIASPHNSASVHGWGDVALQRALANCARVLQGQPARYLVGDDERAARPS
jgi:glycerate dehydrogenase